MGRLPEADGGIANAIECGADLTGEGAGMVGGDASLSVPDKQRVTQPFLKQAHLSADRPVRQSEFKRRIAQAMRTCGRLEDAQGVERGQVSLGHL